jgi:hypothetical protein
MCYIVVTWTPYEKMLWSPCQYSRSQHLKLPLLLFQHPHVYTCHCCCPLNGTSRKDNEVLVQILYKERGTYSTHFLPLEVIRGFPFTSESWRKTHFRDLATPLLLLMTIFNLSLHKESLSKFCARRGYVFTHFLQLEVIWGLPFTSESWRKTKFSYSLTVLMTILMYHCTRSIATTFALKLISCKIERVPNINTYLSGMQEDVVARLCRVMILRTLAPVIAHL